MSRHQLTTEERRKGAQATNAKLAASGKQHRLTRSDCVKGGKAYHDGKNHHLLTSAERRRGGLVTAAKRRAERARALVTLALGDGGKVPEAPIPPCAAAMGCLCAGHARGNPAEEPCDTSEVPAKRDSQDPHTPGCAFAGDPNTAGCCVGYPLLQPPAVEALYQKGASLAGKLRTPPELWPDHEENDPNLADTSPEPIDPFTLSALKRFRLGPLSPLALTRSQRAQIDVMMNAGYIERTPDDFLALTEKGWGAIKAGDLETVKPMGDADAS